MQKRIQLQDKLVSVLSTDIGNTFIRICNSNVDKDLSGSEENKGSDGEDDNGKNNNNSERKDVPWNFADFLNEIFWLNYIFIKNKTVHNVYAILKYTYPSHEKLKWYAKINFPFCSAGVETENNANRDRPEGCSDTVKPDEIKKFYIHWDAKGADVTCKKNDNVGESLGNTIFVPRNITHTINSEPMPIYESKICIENRTSYDLHISKNGGSEIVLKTNADATPTRSYLTVEGESVKVTIKNNKYRDLCCGWIKDFDMGKGDIYHVEGDPKLRIKDNCPHVQY
jgi:hypothetical protein